jgi:hypothetical protein
VKWLLAAFVAGVVLMVAFEHVVTRVLGLACLFGFIVGGVFLIADPAFLRDEGEEPTHERSG